MRRLLLLAGALVVPVLIAAPAQAVDNVICVNNPGGACDQNVATTVCFLDGGRILEQGPPSQLLVSPREGRTQQFLRRVLPPAG